MGARGIVPLKGPASPETAAGTVAAAQSGAADDAPEPLKSVRTPNPFLDAKRLLLQPPSTTASTADEAKVHCRSCGQPCRSGHYECLRQRRLRICRDCFEDGRFPDAYYSGDFAHVTQEAGTSPQASSGDASSAATQVAVSTSSNVESPDVKQRPWTEQQILLLLEGIEMYGETWDRVAAHVGQPRKACIRQFLQLPIDDPFLGADHTPARHAPSSVAGKRQTRDSTADALLIARLADTLRQSSVTDGDAERSVAWKAKGAASELAKQAYEEARHAVLEAASALTQKVDLKLQHLAQVEGHLLQERERVARAWHDVSTEKSRLRALNDKLLAQLQNSVGTALMADGMDLDDPVVRPPTASHHAGMDAHERRWTEGGPRVTQPTDAASMTISGPFKSL